MCGIVGNTGTSPNPQSVIDGLRRLEYRGYDSAGIAGANGTISYRRAVGKLMYLEAALARDPLPSDAMAHIGHTRWATHGPATELNAHPHVVGRVAVVHNGIIENHAELRVELEAAGAVFSSETDTEVIAHLIDRELQYQPNLTDAVRQAVTRLKGAYAIGIISPTAPDTIVAVRKGSPLVIGLGDEQNMIGSDAFAIAKFTPEVMYLDDGDIAVVTPSSVRVFDQRSIAVDRPTKHVDPAELADKGEFPHFMLKEIHEQPDAVRRTLGQTFEAGFLALLPKIKAVHIIACGTSRFAGETAKRWFTRLGLPTEVYIASEYRVDEPLVQPGTLFVAISQSGETADTLEAMRRAKALGYLITCTICNSPDSTMVREADYSFITLAGREQAVASTKAFVTQLVAFQLVIGKLAQLKGVNFDSERDAIQRIPIEIQHVLQKAREIYEAAKHYQPVTNAFFLARRDMVPVADEGALKLMEISYVHASGYAAGEMKHGAIALVDSAFLNVCIMTKDGLEEKMTSSIQEVLARGSQVLVFAEDGVKVPHHENLKTIRLGKLSQTTAAYAVVTALQLFAYYMAVVRGTDVDQPRNLAKSVTVE